MFLLSSTCKSDGVANLDPIMKISWCYDPYQRSSQRGWRILIPQQDKFMLLLLLSSTYKSEGGGKYWSPYEDKLRIWIGSFGSFPHSLSSTRMMMMMMMMMMILLRCGATSGLEGTCSVVLDSARIQAPNTIKHPTVKMKHPDCVAVPSQLGGPMTLGARMPPLCLPLWVILRKPRRWVGGGTGVLAARSLSI